MVGKTLSHFRILSKIGEGGMGEVYKGVDTKLHREVAIKVLPDTLARDSERLARFEREAKLLASLNHVNIATIYGLEESDGLRFLVLELVPGETLAERLAVGPLPIEEALSVCRQIAEAVEAAHAKGVIHRDLKPANVKVTPEGQVKVLDFGLAKVFGIESSPSDPRLSPTVTQESTREGVILGTAAYMSPEQARGKPVDKRSDIWSFGCILHEVLTGRQAFGGATVSDSIAAILHCDVDWATLPATSPATICHLLRRCLEKDANRRLHDIADARIELDEALDEVTRDPSSIAPAIGARHPVQSRTIWGTLGVLAALAVITVGIAIWRFWNPMASVPRRLTHLNVLLPPTQTLSLKERPCVALSPDGTRLIYVANIGDGTMLYLRDLGQPDARPIPGTEDASGPFFSPDGQSVGYFAGAKLKKVSLMGGAPVTLADAPLPRGGCWGSHDSIIFTPAPGAGLWRVPARGGTAEALTSTSPEKNELTHRWPEILPGGEAVVFVVRTTNDASFNEARIALLSLETGDQRILVEGGSPARYAPTGHLVFARAGSLVAVPFDLSRLEVTGQEIPVLGGLMSDPDTGSAHFTFSGDGSLVYVPGGEWQARLTLALVDRDGQAQRLPLPALAFEQPSFSPDGSRLGVVVTRGANDEVWVFDTSRDQATPLSSTRGSNQAPVWSPDGRWIAFSSNRAGTYNIFRKQIGSSATAELLLESDNAQFANSWSPDGQALAFTEYHPTRGADLWVLSMEVGRNVEVFLGTQFDEYGAVFSPDGKWLAYTSNESGRDQIYLSPFPATGDPLRISSEGGAWPVWDESGHALYYRNGKMLMACAIRTEPEFSFETPRKLFEGNFESSLPIHPNYGVSPDGLTFVMVARSEGAGQAQLNVVLNWFEELKSRVPSAR